MTRSATEIISKAKKSNSNTLHLYDLELTDWPMEIFEFGNLKTLSLFSNNLKEIPKEIERLTNLEELTLNSNQISVIPDEISKLTKLKRFSISFNKITHIPASFWNLTSIEKLEIGNIRSFNNNIVPDGVYKLKSLQELDISGFKSDGLQGLKQLTNLRALKLSFFMKVPNVIFELVDLRELDLSYGSLTTLPNEFGKLKNLQILDLRSNNFSTFPIIITSLLNLEHLDISGNKIDNIPISIKNLGKLKGFIIGDIFTYKEKETIRGNHIVELPSSIGELKNLHTLKIAHNRLSSLPVEIRNLPLLKELNLIGNPIEIPPEILEKHSNPEAIFAVYFGSAFSAIQTDITTQKQKIKPEVSDKKTPLFKRKSLNESKLLIVGQGSVGKTSIIQRMLKGMFDKNQNKTDGILISRWQVKEQGSLKLNTQIQLNIWDFGGQEIMHATHQFFLTKRSLYLLVLDSRLTQEENRVEY